MEPGCTGAFQSLAEFGIALAGFTSIVVVFTRRSGEFHPADRFRILVALVPSLSAAFLALVPVGLDLTGLAPSAVWRLSSVVLVVVVALDAVQTMIRLRGASPEVRAILSAGVSAVIRALRLLALVAGLLNATGVIFAPQPGVYFFAVLCPLLVGSIVFVRMVFVRPAV